MLKNKYLMLLSFLMLSFGISLMFVIPRDPDLRIFVRMLSIFCMIQFVVGLYILLCNDYKLPKFVSVILGIAMLIGGAFTIIYYLLSFGEGPFFAIFDGVDVDYKIILIIITAISFILIALIDIIYLVVVGYDTGENLQSYLFIILGPLILLVIPIFKLIHRIKYGKYYWK